MKTEIIKFHDTEIIAYQIDDRWYIAINTIAKAIGLYQDSARRAIKKDEILGPEHVVRTVQVDENQSRSYVLLPIEYVQGWLFGIDVKKVKEEVRPVLILYKKECYKVLFDHFFGKNRQINNSLEERYRLATYLKKINKLINVIMKRHKEVKAQIELIDNHNYAQLGLFK